MSDTLWKTLIYHGEIFDRFEISSEGQIRNANTCKVYKTFINKKGYEQVCVSLGSANKKKVFKIHRAVAETFIQNPENKPEVNHKNGDKLNNNVSNLEWATSSENMTHAAKTGLLNPLQGADNPQAKLSPADITYIREHYKPYDSEFGARALGRKFNVNKNIIRNVANFESYVNV